MNGVNSLGAARDAGAAGDAGEADFDAAFQEQLGNTAAVMFQFLGADIIESVMKHETAPD